MGEVIEFPDRNAPDEDQTYTDYDGVKWFQFSASYEDTKRDRLMSFYLWATSFEDASDRLEMIASKSSIEGQCLSMVDFDDGES